MRRLCFSVLAMSFAATLVGCWHIAGVCDCYPERNFCGPTGCCGGAGPAISTVSHSSNDISTIPPVTNNLP